MNGNRIFMELSSLRIVDRFYIKRCNRCQGFGHYAKDCSQDQVCGYCCASDHSSSGCHKKVESKNYYSCINCKKSNRNSDGHSTHWMKCPTYLELQDKLKKGIPYYAKNCHWIHCQVIIVNCSVGMYVHW